MAEWLKDSTTGALTLRNGNPVLLIDGAETVVDGDHFQGLVKSRGKVSDLQTKLEAAEEKLAGAQGELSKIGKTSDERAQILELASKARAFDEKKLIDAGKVEEVVKERIKTMAEQHASELSAINAKLEATNGTLSRVMIDEPFAGVTAKGGPFDSADWTPTASLVRGLLAQHFRVENGKRIGYKRLPGTNGSDDPGEKIFNAQGELANFSEAITALRDAHPERDQWKRSKASGGGAPGGAPGTNGSNKISAEQFEAMSPREQMDFSVKGGEVVTQ